MNTIQLLVLRIHNPDKDNKKGIVIFFILTLLAENFKNKKYTSKPKIISVVFQI